MYWNDFSVRIPEGRENGGYIEMEHGKQYSLVLRNGHEVQCDAQVDIDGKTVGTWRIYANSSIQLERPVNDSGRFTFYRAGTPEAQQAQLPQGSNDLGLVRVTFTPAKKIKVKPLITYRSANNLDEPAMAGVPQKYEGVASLDVSNRAPGGTGLSGKSGQMFHVTTEIEYDYSQQTVIHLRLVATEGGDTPRPLIPLSTPVPPPVQ